MESQIGFSQIEPYEIGSKLGRASFGLMELARVGFLGSDVLGNLGAITDYPNYCIRFSDKSSATRNMNVILVQYHCAAIKAKESLQFPDALNKDIFNMARRFHIV